MVKKYEDVIFYSKITNDDNKEGNIKETIGFRIQDKNREEKKIRDSTLSLTTK